jgi:hypothetical protein
MGDYVYIRSEPTLWTVGFYRPDGKWEPESDHGSESDAADRVMRLHGVTPDDYGPRTSEPAVSYADLLAGLRRALGCKFLDCDVRRELRALVARAEGKDKP